MKIMSMLVFGMFLFLAVGVSADVAILGTIYDGTAGNGFVGGASVNVVCDGNSASDISENDGTYAVSFNDSECNENHSWSISLTKSGYNFNSQSEAIIYSDMVNLSVFYSIVVDFVLTEKIDSNNGGGSSNGGSSGGGGSCSDSFWDCEPEWSECASGSQERTCNSNCGNSKVETQVCTTEEVLVKSEIVSENKDADIVEPNRFFSAITGAVIGGGAKGIGIGILFIIIVAALFSIVRNKRK